MIDLTKLHTMLVGTVGLYPGSNAAYADQFSDADHNNPVVYLQDAHKLLRSDVLTALGPNLSVADASLMDWYTQIEKGAINKLGLLISSNPPSKPLLESTSLYPKEANLQGALNKTGRFLALRFTLPKRDTAINLVKLGLQVTGPVSGVPLYLFHSDTSNHLKLVNITDTRSGRTVWASFGEYLYNAKGGYYLAGYFESDLPSGVSAVGAARGWNLASCSTCGSIENEFIRSRSPYLTIEPVFVENVGTDRTLSWAEEKTVDTQSWGLNAVIEVQCDITNTLLTNKDMLINAYLHMLACDVLEEISTSDRVNATKKELKSLAYIALHGQKDSDKGLADERKTVIVGLKAVLEKMRPCCVTAESRREIRFENAFD
jgi:hypothetical protein